MTASGASEARLAGLTSDMGLQGASASVNDRCFLKMPYVRPYLRGSASGLGK